MKNDCISVSDINFMSFLSEELIHVISSTSDSIRPLQKLLVRFCCVLLNRQHHSAVLYDIHLDFNTCKC